MTCFAWCGIIYDFITTWEDPIVFDESRVFASDNGDPTIRRADNKTRLVVTQDKVLEECIRLLLCLRYITSDFLGQILLTAAGLLFGTV